MPQVVIVHGWSDTSKSFEPLARFLAAKGHTPVPIWLGDYISMEDDVRVPDVAKRLEAELRARVAAGSLVQPFDMIVHSTGGLVVREWIATYNTDGWRPVRRCVMLAPANFGSSLAAKGKSMLGRLVKGWNHWFHTGQQMLDALELSSPYQWDLVRRDSFLPRGAAGAPAFYGPDRVWPFVLVGSHPYPGTLQQITNEDGGDGTVRASAANLNVHGATLDFSRDEENPTFTAWAKRHDFLMPFAVLPARTHASIIRPEDPDVETGDDYVDPLGALLLEALACPDFAEYGEIAKRWAVLSEDTAALVTDPARRKRVLPDDDPAKSAQFLHQHMQLNVHVVDDDGREVGDYFLEFFGPGKTSGDPEAVYFHREVLEKVSVNTTNASCRCLYLDRTDLVEHYYRDFFPDPAKGALLMSISAAPPGDNVQYFQSYKKGAAGLVRMHADDAGGRWFRRNATHFLEIVIPRVPAERVFRLRPFGA